MKILIVEDELHMRVKLKSILLSLENYILDIDEASNGQEAFMKLRDHSYDLIFLDIKMPVMDGLEFLEKLDVFHYKENIVVLSSYNDYPLVRKTMKLGVKDYIYKPLLTHEEINGVMKAYLVENPINKEMSPVDMSKEGHDNILTGITNRLLENNIAALKQNQLLLLCKYLHKTVDSKLNDKNIRESIVSVTGEIVKNTEHVSILCTYGNFICLKVDLEKVVSRLQIYTTLEKFCGKLSRALALYANTSVCIGTSMMVDREITVREAVEDSFESMKWLFWQNLSYQSDMSKIDKRPKGQTHELLSFERIVKKLSSLLEKGQYDLARNFLLNINEIYDYDHVDWVQMNYELEELKFIMIHYATLSDDIDIVKGLRGLKASDLLTYRDFEEKLQWALESLSQKEHSFDVFENGSISQQVYDYMKDHYAEVITLESVSKHIDRNSSYLSRVFKEETGQTFTECLNHIRIIEAKKLLLTTDLKIYHIAELVGYKNLDSFHNYFKKAVKVSPNKYRRNFGDVKITDDM